VRRRPKKPHNPPCPIRKQNADATLSRQAQEGTPIVKHRDLAIPEAGPWLLRRARVPGVFLAKPQGVTPDAEGSVLLDILVDAGRIARIAPAGGIETSAPVVDVEGRLVWATLLDMHTHLDKGQVIPRAMPDGTLDGGMTGTFEDRKRWTSDDIAARMGFGLRCAYHHGVSAIRTHLDSMEDIAPLSFRVFRDLRDAWAGRVELQAVGLAPLTFYKTGWGERLADLVAESGAVLGGTTDAIGHFSGAVNEEFVEILTRFLAIASARGLDVDLHTDQTEDPSLFTLPLIAETVLRTGFKGRVVVDHCVNLALQTDEVIARTLRLCREAGLLFVTLPTPMMYLQDRKPGRTPRWRGVTAAQEILAAGIPIAIGGDNCRDAWFPFGDHDMVDTVQQSVRVYQLDDPIAQAAAMAGPIPADIIAEPSAGRIAEGGPARLILFNARTMNEFMCRPQSDRIVVNQGRRVTEPLPDYAELDAVLAPRG
jgi:cytosine deaminase